jgi:hypothetical protein
MRQKNVYYAVINQFGHCDVEIKGEINIWRGRLACSQDAAGVENHAARISHLVNVGSEKIISVI